MREAAKFKPLWRIHNQVYRHYAKGCFVRRVVRYWGKLKALAKLLLRPILRRLGR